MRLSLKPRLSFLPAILLLAVISPSSLPAQHFFSSNRALVNPEPLRLPSARREEAMLARPVEKALRETSDTTVKYAGPVVRGRRAVLRRGIAYAPVEAPEEVKRLIWAVNTLRRKPYKWGGGHGSFYDSGYDCSGTISFALHHAGLLKSPLTSMDFKNWGRRGRGRWITVYTQNGHVFAMVAGLRLDAMGMSRRDGPRWHRDSRSTFGFTARSVPGF